MARDAAPNCGRRSFEFRHLTTAGRNSRDGKRVAHCPQMTAGKTACCGGVEIPRHAALAPIS